MQVHILNQHTPTAHAQSATVHAELGTDVGLVKPTNEDRIGYSLDAAGNLTVCIADGHWGETAADLAVRHFLNDPGIANRYDAEQSATILERELYTLYGKTSLDQDLDRPPETAFLQARFQTHGLSTKLQVVSYGDCRLCIISQGVVRYTHQTDQTWLGAFSHRGLRQRQPIHGALRYRELVVTDQDIVLLFTDGVDECVYEAPTLSPENLAAVTAQFSPAESYRVIMQMVHEHGAEDNASLAICSLSKYA